MSSLPSRFGINLPGHPIREYIEMARYADRLGVDSIWVTETRLATDAIVPLAAYAAATELSPLKGSSPVTISYMTIPIEKMSLLWFTRWPRACSGLM